MALPWLIGGAIVGGIALVSKLASGSDGDDDYDDEEEVRRRAARDRKNRELTERLDALVHLVKEEGEKQAPIFQRQLESNFKVVYKYQPYAGSIDNDGFLNKSYDSLCCHIDSKEQEILSDEQRERLEAFLTFYNVEEMKVTQAYSYRAMEDATYHRMIESLKDECLPQLIDLYMDLGGSDKDLEHLVEDFEKIDAFERGPVIEKEEGWSSALNYFDKVIDDRSDHQNDKFQGEYIIESSLDRIFKNFKDIDLKDVQDAKEVKEAKDPNYIKDIKGIKDINKSVNAAINELLESLDELKK